MSENYWGQQADQQSGGWFTGAASGISGDPYHAFQQSSSTGSDGFFSGPSVAGGAPATMGGPLAGSLSPAAAPTSYSGQMFMPAMQQQGQSFGGAVDEDELPLLEELGINFDHIGQKTMAVLNPLKQTTQEAITDQDLAGPLVFCLLFGCALLLHGKVHFGYIYGIGVLGCLGMWGLINLMASSNHNISLTCTVSILGYCLLPMALLSLFAAVMSFRGAVGYGLSAVAVFWCSLSASKLFVTTLAMDHQRFLVGYPCFLLYGIFVLLAIF